MAQSPAFRQELAAEGQAYLSRAGGGAGVGDLPRINGGAAEEAAYIRFCSASKSRLLIYHTGSKRYLGELKPGSFPVIVPLGSVSAEDFPAGQMVKNPNLLSMAGTAAQQAGKSGDQAVPGI